MQRACDKLGTQTRLATKMKLCQTETSSHTAGFVKLRQPGSDFVGKLNVVGIFNFFCIFPATVKPGDKFSPQFMTKFTIKQWFSFQRQFRF